MNVNVNMNVNVRVETMSEPWIPALRALFEEASSTCFCRYWHFVGTKNDWLDRCANRPEENAAELEAAVRSGDPSGQGLVAIVLEGDDEQRERVVGWMKLTARENLKKLRALPVYKNLDLGDETTTFSIGCMLVHPDFRKHGVARALVTAAPRLAVNLGQATPRAKFVEAYPRHSDSPLYPEEAWQGPERVFIQAGFDIAHDTPPYPVYRTAVHEISEK